MSSQLGRTAGNVMHQTICRAIRQRRVLELRYHGYSRLVEPHIHGEDRHGDEVLRCYQLAGGSESGERAGWKLLKVKEAQHVYLADTEFLPRRDYTPHDKVIRNVFCRVPATLAPFETSASASLSIQPKNQ